MGSLSLPQSGHPVTDLMRIEPGTELAVHAYRLHIEKASFSVHYATIIETHHPDYLGGDELRELYPASAGTDADTIDRINRIDHDRNLRGSRGRRVREGHSLHLEQCIYLQAE